MVAAKNPRTLLLSLAASAWMAGCASEAKNNQKAAKAADDDSTGTDSTDGANVDGETDGEAGGGGAAFDSWCAKASETTTASKDLADSFGKLCDGKKAKAFLSGTLVANAYEGSGTAKLKFIVPIASDKATKTTTAFIGVGIKLPISIQDHFEKVGPKAGDEDSQRKLAEAQKATQETLEITKRTSKDKYWKRGWDIHSATSQQTGPIKLETDTKSHSDHFEFEKGKTYMYATVTDEGIKTIKDFSLLTAGIDVDGTGYLLTVAYLVVDNHGLDSIAEGKIKETATALVKSMYDAAKQ